MRSDALAAHRFSAPRTRALVLANVDARASSSSKSTAAGALLLLFPLTFPFRSGTAVGDAISTSCGEMGDLLVFGSALDNDGSTLDRPTDAGKSSTVGRLEMEGDGSDAKEFLADITNGLKISSEEVDCTEGQPKRLLPDFCFRGKLNEWAVGVPGREMGCILGGGGCCGEGLISPFSEVGGRSVGLNPSMTVGWRSSRSCKDGCLTKPLKDGADWLVAKLAGGGAEGRVEESGDVLIGVRIGRVGVEDVERTGGVVDGPKGFAVDAPSNAGLGGVVPNWCPGEKAGAVGLSVPVGARSSFSVEAEAMVAPVPKPVCNILVGNPEGALWEDEKAGVMTAVVWTCDVAAAGPLNGELKIDVAARCPSLFKTAGVEADDPNGKKEEFAFVGPRNAAESPPALETPCTEGSELPKAEGGAPKAEEEEPPNAEPDPKLLLPKTFGVVLIFANADAVEGAGAGTEEPNAEVDGAPKTEVEELAPEASNMTEGEGRTPKLLESHSVALGLSVLGRCWCSSISSGSSATGPSSRKKASSSS